MLYGTLNNFDNNTFNLFELLKEEIFGEDNSNILETLRDDFITNSDLLKQIEDYIFTIECENCLDDISEEEQNTFCKKIIEEINRKTNKNLQFGIWLGEYDFVKGFFSLTSYNKMFVYKESDIILEDLDEYKLYLYETMEDVEKLVISELKIDKFDCEQDKNDKLYLVKELLQEFDENLSLKNVHLLLQEKYLDRKIIHKLLNEDVVLKFRTSKECILLDEVSSRDKMFEGNLFEIFEFFEVTEDFDFIRSLLDLDLKCVKGPINEFYTRGYKVIEGISFYQFSLYVKNGNGLELVCYKDELLELFWNEFLKEYKKKYLNNKSE